MCECRSVDSAAVWSVVTRFKRNSANVRSLPTVRHIKTTFSAGVSRGWGQFDWYRPRRFHPLERFPAICVKPASGFCRCVVRSIFTKLRSIHVWIATKKTSISVFRYSTRLICNCLPNIWKRGVLYTKGLILGRCPRTPGPPAQAWEVSYNSADGGAPNISTILPVGGQHDILFSSSVIDKMTLDSWSLMSLLPSAVVALWRPRRCVCIDALLKLWIAAKMALPICIPLNCSTCCRATVAHKEEKWLLEESHWL